MNQERLMHVLLAPHISEKTAMAAESGNQYVFKVARDANKTEIRAAVEKLFEVNVESVRVLNVKGKTKRFKTFLGRRSHWKKAYVRLAEGQTIDIAAE